MKKKNQTIGSHVGTRENLSVDVSITNVGLISTDLISRRTESQSTDKIQFQNFFEKKIKFWGFHGVVLDLSIDVSITNVGLILTAKAISDLRFKIEFQTFLISNFWVAMV